MKMQLSVSWKKFYVPDRHFDKMMIDFFCPSLTHLFTFDSFFAGCFPHNFIRFCSIIFIRVFTHFLEASFTFSPFLFTLIRGNCNAICTERTIHHTSHTSHTSRYLLLSSSITKISFHSFINFIITKSSWYWNRTSSAIVWRKKRSSEKQIENWCHSMCLFGSILNVRSNCKAFSQQSPPYLLSQKHIHIWLQFKWWWHTW